MKEEVTRCLFPYSEGGWRWPWWQREVGNAGGGACSARLEVEEAGWADWAKNKTPSGPVKRLWLVGLIKEKKIKKGFDF
jgi:hypothetical protein